MLETLDTLRSRARQRTRQVLLAEHVHRDWAVNTSKEPPESSMNRGIDLSTNPNCRLKYSEGFDALDRESKLAATITRP